MKRTLIWAHRGASGYAPENTMEAFRIAEEMQADGIELDVQMTKDGTLVVTHDEKIDRVSNGSGWVKDFTYEQISKYDFARVCPGHKQERIPTLQEVFEWAKQSDMTINIEIKSGVVFYQGIEEKTLELAEREGMADRVIYSSFNHYTVKNIKKLNPDAQTGMLYSDGMIEPAGYAQYIVEADALHPALYNLQYTGFMEECRRHGRKVHVWTVNEEAYMRMVCGQGVDAMITNYPDLGLKIAKEYEQ